MDGETLVSGLLELPPDDFEVVMRVLRRAYRGEVSQAGPTDKARALHTALDQLDNHATPQPRHPAIGWTMAVAPLD